MLLNNEQTSKLHATTTPNPKLILKEKEIRSLSDLRNHFDMDQVLDAHMSGALRQWLANHFYEQEAETVSELSLQDPYCKRKLCEILGITMPISEEEAEDLKQRKEKLLKYTEDPEILKKVRNVAFDQEDLADLINAEVNTIYLCKGEFSIPLSKPNIHYIGIADPVIENPFTRHQYKKAGITVDNIKLPQNTSMVPSNYAEEAAKKNGYDDFHENHSTFTTAIHELLKTEKYEKYLYFFKDGSFGFNNYHSRHECKKAGEQAIKKTYDEAKRYFDTDYADCITDSAAQKYEKIIMDQLHPLMKPLETYCKAVNHTDTFHRIRNLVINAKENLTKTFKKELNDSSDYYSLYRLDYFLDQLTVEEHDLRMEDGIMRMLEWLDPKSFEYSYDGAVEAMDEIEKDANSKASTFYSQAYEDYKDYISKIETLIEVIGKDMPPLKEGENITTYLKHQTIRNVK